MSIKGLIAAPFTPMKDDFSINYELIEKLTDYYATQPLEGVFINGTTGESMSLTVQERIELANQWVKHAAGRFKVIVHVGHTCIEDCKKMSSHAQGIGAYATGAMGPCFFRPASVDALVDFCSEIANAAPKLPFYYYHMPAMTGNDFLMRDFLEAADGKIENLAGIKFTHENLMDYRRCVDFKDGKYNILWGRDEILLSGLVMGAQGAVGSTYNYMASVYVQIMEDYKKGNLAKALSLQNEVIEIITMIIEASGGVACGKALMNMHGFDLGPCRSPLPKVDYKDLGNIIEKILAVKDES